MKQNNIDGLVYSTETGKTCPKCGNPVKHCNCKKSKGTVPRDGIVRISRETKGRKGAGMTVITGIPLSNEKLKDLAKKLKQKLGTGGTVKAGTIEIQGDYRDLLKQELSKMGYTVKLSGG